MPSFADHPVVTALARERCLAIMRTNAETGVGAAMEAALGAGFRVAEFTLGTPGALELVATFARRDDVLVGAGTVLTPDQARAAVDAGARFLVSPVVDEAVIETAHGRGVPMLPGCHTPTELLRAHRAGAPVQKLFPPAGPEQARAVLGPLPFLRLLPTSSVDATNAAAYLEAGCFAVGFVGALFDDEEIAGGRVDLVAARARLLLAAVQRAR
jgi:2-dehydro-3-deoxyphosphogluconate aldolase/(4S)-4-hydroxy-2-oxoglutarate aldolase